MTLLYAHWAGLNAKDAKRAAAFVLGDDRALLDFELGATTYPPNVAVELDRAIDARNRKNDKDN